MCTNAMSIALRHVKIIARLGDMSEHDEPVDELVRTTVRNCLLAMQAAGAEAADAAEIIEELLQHELELLPLEKEKFRHVLEAAHLHAEYLVVSDRKFLH